MFSRFIFTLNIVSLLLGNNNIYYDPAEIGQEFPETREVSYWYETSVNIQDLGYSTGYTSTSGINNAQHRYNFEYTTIITCNQACSLRSPDKGYNISSNIIVITHQQNDSDTPTGLAGKINQWTTKKGYGNSSYTFNSASDEYSVNVTIGYISNQSQVVTLYFPALTEGRILSSLNSNIETWSTLWGQWSILDELYKEQVLRFMIFQMTNSGNYISPSVMQTIQNDLNNGNYDDAYTVINNYYYNQIDDNNGVKDEITSDFNSTNTDLVSTTNDFMNFEDSQKQTMKEQLQQIDFNFNGNQFQQSATFYKKVFTDFVGSTQLFIPISVILFITLLMILLGAFHV